MIIATGYSQVYYASVKNGGYGFDNLCSFAHKLVLLPLA